MGGELAFMIVSTFFTVNSFAWSIWSLWNVRRQKKAIHPADKRSDLNASNDVTSSVLCTMDAHSS
jgi:hypothetical protein